MTDPLNPKDLIGQTKVPLEIWPASATAMGAVGLYEGLSKYGRENYLATPVRASIYVAAAKRHIDAWFEGEDNSPEGVPHLGNAIACLAILVDAGTHNTLVDDRRYTGPEAYRALLKQLTGVVEKLQKDHQDKAPKHYHKGVSK